MVGWAYETATTLTSEDTYSGWTKGISTEKPNVPPGSIRSLRPLYAGPEQDLDDPLGFKHIIWEALQDSFDVDWNATDGAKAVFKRLEPYLYPGRWGVGGCK